MSANMLLAVFAALFQETSIVGGCLKRPERRRAFIADVLSVTVSTCPESARLCYVWSSTSNGRGKHVFLKPKCHRNWCIRRLKLPDVPLSISLILIRSIFASGGLRSMKMVDFVILEPCKSELTNNEASLAKIPKKKTTTKLKTQATSDPRGGVKWVFIGCSAAITLQSQNKLEEPETLLMDHSQDVATSLFYYRPAYSRSQRTPGQQIPDSDDSPKYDMAVKMIEDAP
uniref:Secreted protein n=1 Tax=Panagrellus redivivus TaxID=6233 RepID=A0A7E4ZPS1_PANRE